jgi:steroid 5-alpha reductase family enzyme
MTTHPPDAVSVRTWEEPMAFTSGEFLRGTVVSWLAFNLLFALALVVSETSTHDPVWGPLAGMLAVLLIYSVPIALVVSGIVTLLCCGAAWALGSRLRRTRSLAPHVIGYTVLGTVIGAVVVGGYQLVVVHTLDLGNWLALLVLICSAAALPLGWGWAVRHARRTDAGLIRPARADPDEAFEDSL